MASFREKQTRRERAASFFCIIFCCVFSFFPIPSSASKATRLDSPGKDEALAPEVARHEDILPQGNVTVFIYHRFGEDRYPSTNVDVDRFQEQLAYLRNNNYQVLPLADLIRRLTEGRPLPNKTAIITIDDGYKSVYEKAWPVLKTFGFPFTVFLYMKATDNGHWDYMTWEQVRELRAEGVDFQNHGYSHHHLSVRPAETSDEEYRAWIRKDLIKGSQIMQKNLGYRPAFLAVPYGEYNRTILDEAKALGYRALFTQDPGSVSKDTDLFSIPREPILGTDWSTMAHFEMVLKRMDLPISEMEPESGSLKESMPPRFKARLLYPERYRPGTLGIYVSELGWQPADLQDGYVSIVNTRPLRRQFNRVAVSGREKLSGQTAIRFWLLVNENYAQ